MIALLYASTSIWLPAKGTLLVQDADVPFSVEAVTCACHGHTWYKPRGNAVLRYYTWPKR